MGIDLLTRGRHGSFDQIATRVEKRVGKIPVTGRFHRYPERLEQSYILTRTVLGSGQSGEIVLAHGVGNRRELNFAVKTFSLRHIEASDLQELESEVEVFLTIDHPHIARLIDVFETSDSLHLVMECLEGGELFDRVTEVKAFSEQDAAEAARQMLLAVNYLHSLGIAHRDLKLENFLYESKGSSHLKLIDFGLSKFWDSSLNMSASCGTISYAAPEIFQNSYTSQCDLWSVGVLVFILVGGYMPFSGPDHEAKKAIMEGRYTMKPECWEGISSDGQGFVKSLLEVDAARRPTATEALAHPWIAQRDARNTGRMNVDDSIADSLRRYGQASKFRRACLSMIAWSLSSAEQDKVRTAFLEIDLSNEGTITLSEFRQALSGRVDEPEIDRMFQTLDSNLDERIHYTDFLAAMVSTRIALHDDLLRIAFDRFDADRSDYITPENLREKLGANFEGADIDQLISEADYKRDGRISFEEFVAFLTGKDLCGIGLEKLRPISNKPWCPLPMSLSHLLGCFSLSTTKVAHHIESI